MHIAMPRRMSAHPTGITMRKRRDATAAQIVVEMDRAGTLLKRDMIIMVMMSTLTMIILSRITLRAKGRISKTIIPKLSWISKEYSYFLFY